MKRKLTIVGVIAGMVAAISLGMGGMGPVSIVQAATIEVSQATQITDNSYYERGQSIVSGGTYYWLFYGLSTQDQCHYGDCNPDDNNYEIYYKKATSLSDLAGATASMVTGADNIYQGQTSCVYYSGKVWVFAADETLADHSIKAWNTTDGSSWTEHDTGFDGCGAPHLWATVYDAGTGDEIFLVYNAPGGKLQVRTYNGTSWSAAVDASINEGMPRFYEDSIGDLHMIWCSWGMPAYYIHTYDTGWFTMPDYSIPGTGNLDCDPTLFQIGGSGDYCLMYAPWDGTKQYIAGWTASTLSGLATAESHDVTKGGYGSTPWVDMWPIAFNDGNGDYLFFTSERQADGTRSPGNIWYMKVDWDPYNDHYTYIQNAIDEATSGDKILVGPGSWVGATVTKAVEIIGEEGAFIDDGPQLIPYPLRTGFFFPPGGSGSGATIRGFTFMGVVQSGGSDDGNLDFPIFSRGADNVTIKNNVMYDSLQAISNWEGSGWHIRNNTIDGLWVLNGGGIGIIIASRFGTPASDNFVGFNQISANIVADSDQYTTAGICLMSDARWSFPGGPVEDNKVLHNEIAVWATYGGIDLPGCGIELTDVGFAEDNTLPNVQGNKVGQNDPSGSQTTLACYPEELVDHNVIRNNPGSGAGHGLPPAAIFD